MEIRLLEENKKQGKLTFMIKDGNACMANALRRSIAEEVPTMAIEDVEIRKNTGLLYDEIIAHRLGLTPLTTDLKSYNLPSECKCEGKGCARCQLTITLKGKGPGIVLASELESKDSGIKPVFKNMPIAKLLKNQVLEVEATAMLGQGKTHSKWKPAHVYYKLKPEIEIDAKCDGCQKCVEACPTKTLGMKGSKAEVVKDNLLKCHLCNACVEACPKKLISVSKSNDYIFTIESYGQLEPKEIFNEAINQLNKQIDEFDTIVKKSLS